MPVTNEHRRTNQTFYDRISRAYDFIADANEHKAREAGEPVFLGDSSNPEILRLAGIETARVLVVSFTGYKAAEHIAKAVGVVVDLGLHQVVQVFADAVVQDSHVETTATDADYALWATGGTESGSLKTTYLGNNAHDGAMFDITAHETVRRSRSSAKPS